MYNINIVTKAIDPISIAKYSLNSSISFKEYDGNIRALGPVFKYCPAKIKGSMSEPDIKTIAKRIYPFSTVKDNTYLIILDNNECDTARVRSIYNRSYSSINRSIKNISISIWR